MPTLDDITSCAAYTVQVQQKIRREMVASVRQFADSDAPKVFESEVSGKLDISASGELSPSISAKIRALGLELLDISETVDTEDAKAEAKLRRLEKRAVQLGQRPTSPRGSDRSSAGRGQREQRAARR